EPQPQRAAVERLLDRPAPGLSNDRAVFLAHRARDPGDVVVCHESAQGGDEASAAAPCHAFAVVPRVRHGSAVRDDDQLPAGAIHGCTLTTSALKKRPGAFPRYAITSTRSTVTIPSPTISSSTGRILSICSAESTISITTGRSSESRRSRAVWRRESAP